MCSVPVHDTVTGRVVLERSDVDSLTCAYACLRMSIYTHVITSAVTQMQRCREDKGESTAAGGWEVRRSSRPSVQVCLDECGSAVLFDVPPSWLMDCGRVELSGLLTSHSSTRWI